MTTTYIDTLAIPRRDLGQQGEVAEILNRELCGAENVLGALRWLEGGERFEAAPLPATHQLIYLMEGEGTIELEGKDYAVRKGSGIYLGPTETASVRHTGQAPLKLFHLVVPEVADR